MTVIEILKQNDFIENGEVEIYSLLEIVVNWPIVKFENDDEEIDLENWKITQLNNDKMTIACGGDWQEPLTFDLVPHGELLKATNIKHGYNGKEIPDEKIIEILN